MVLYLLQQYNGPVRWIRYPLKVPDDKIQQIINTLYSQYDGMLVGVYHDPNFIVVYLKPIQSYQWEFIIPAILGIIAGGLGVAYFSSKPESGYSSTFDQSNPPGISLSFTDILKIGLIVIIAGAVAYIGVNTYVAYRKSEYLEPEKVVPIRYLYENVGKPVASGIQAVGKGVSSLIKNAT